MVHGVVAACDTIHIARSHGAPIESLAKRQDYYISFRECGRQNVGLIEEHYAMKGPRLHAKSCNWGPMAGFVCLDPRLNKDPANKTGFNRTENNAALTGETHSFDPLARLPAVGRQALRAGGPPIGLEGNSVISELLTGGGMVHGAASLTYRGHVCPIVVSAARIAWLRTEGIINPVDRWQIAVGRTAKKMLTGTSSKDGITIEYRLFPHRLDELRAKGLLGADNQGVYTDGEYYAIQVRRSDRFAQIEGAGSTAFGALAGRWTDGEWTWLLGMTNPERTMETYGFKACVTGDYDLFSVWPKAGRYSGHVVPDRSALGFRHNPGGLDVRPVDRLFGGSGVDPMRFGREPEVVGNITTRLTEVKDLLNAALRAFYRGGDCVLHSDEVGNPAPGLAKPLQECFPMAFFTPHGSFGLGPGEVRELKGVCVDAMARGYRPELKPGWWTTLGLFPKMQLERRGSVGTFTRPV
jgi:Anthrax toxin LF subunit